MEEMREKRPGGYGQLFFSVTLLGAEHIRRSATEKRIRQSLYSPCMVLPGRDISMFAMV
jgi:hypothetical protein